MIIDRGAMLAGCTVWTHPAGPQRYWRADFVDEISDVHVKYGNLFHVNQNIQPSAR